MADHIVGFSEDLLDAEEAGVTLLPLDVIDDREGTPRMASQPPVTSEEPGAFGVDIEMYWSKRILTECTLASRS